jgi:phage shock protein C
MKKLLYKSEDDKKLDGVCAGVAEYFDLDPTLVRAGYALLTAISGFIPGIIGYIVLSIIMPKKSEVQKDGKKVSKT